MANAKGEATAAYMRDYYRAHSTHLPMVPGATRESKRCKQCGETKPREEFSIRQTGRIGHLSTYCKACSADMNQQRIERDPTFYRRVMWPSKLKSQYGITVADYERILAAQGGGCAICRCTDPSGGNRAYRKRKREAFDVDHCHVTGVVRGLLCGRCNRLVGLAGDDPVTAQRLMTYLAPPQNKNH